MPEPPQLAPFDTEGLYEINPKELGNLACQVKGDVELSVLGKTTGNKWYLPHLDKGGTPQPVVCNDIKWNFSFYFYFLYGHIHPLITWTSTGLNPFWRVDILADFSSCCRP